MKTYLYSTLCIILGVATTFTFAPYYLFWLMPILFALFILTLERSTRPLLHAYLFALSAYASQFWWIHTALHDVSGLPNQFAIPLTFLLPLFLALFPLAAIGLYTRLSHPPFIRIGLGLPILWTIAEFARERLFTGFGWGALGYSQIAEYSPLAGLTPIGGIHLTTFATALLGAGLALLFQSTQLKSKINIILAIIGLLGGAWGLSTLQFTQATGPSVRVALAQGNIPQHLKFAPEELARTYQRYYEQIASSQAQIIVLPETAFPEFLQTTPLELLNAFSEQAKANGSALAIGIPAFTPDGQNYKNIMLNASNLPEHATMQDWLAAPQYAKNHLVPFGEYKPLPALTEPLYQLMSMPLADFQRGGENQAPFEMAGQRVAFNICYEDGFGDELIASARRSTVLANASNMAWYGDSNAMWQQLQLSQARSLELGRYMMRATNTGATAIISPKGQILHLAPSNQAIVLEGTIQGMQGETPYMKMGSSWYLIGLLSAMAVLLFRRKKAA